MKVNEENILNDLLDIYSLTDNPSFSKDKKYNSNIEKINRIYNVSFGKQFNSPFYFNPYYLKLYERSYDKDYLELKEFILNYKEYYLQIAKNYLKMQEANDIYFTPSYPDKFCRKTYTDEEVKEILLDFFNEQGTDKYKIVKTIFDEERVETAELGIGGFCSIFFSDIMPYVAINKKKEKLTLLEVFDLAHEFGHAIEAVKMQNRYNEFHKNKNLVLIEVSSRFYELEFLRYLQKNRINVKDANNLLTSHYICAYSYLYELLYSDSNEIYLNGEKYILSSDGFRMTEDRNLERLFAKESDEQINYVVEFPFYKPLIYGLGSYASLHLSELKKHDPKEFNKAWEYYLTSRTLISYKEIIDLFGLDVNKFISGEMIDSIVKKDLTVYRNQLKRQL